MDLEQGQIEMPDPHKARGVIKGVKNRSSQSAMNRAHRWIQVHKVREAIWERVRAQHRETALQD